MEQHPFPSDPIKVIHTKGDDRQIGTQHAEQVGKPFRGMPKFYAELWDNIWHQTASSSLERRSLGLVRAVIEKTIVRRLQGNISPDGAARIKGYADTVGTNFGRLELALILPDLLPVLQSYGVKLKPKSFIEASKPPIFGCSSFVSVGSRFLHGRNLDFPGVAHWDRYPVIQVTRPEGKLASVGFTTAGVPFGGISGVNEAQVSVSLHQHYSREASLKGMLPFLVGEKILSEAQTADQALEIIRDANIGSSWAFIVTDGKSRKAFLCETHPKARGVKWLTQEEPVLAHSNYFQTPECCPSEFATTMRMNWDNYWRKTRLQNLVQSTEGSLTMDQGVRFISDHWDPYWGEEKYVNRIVSQLYNIQSLVLDPEKMVVRMAAGNSPIHLGEYHEYDLGKLLSGDSKSTGSPIKGYQFQDEKKRKAKQHFVLSFIETFEGRYEQALLELKRTLEQDYCCEAALVQSILYMKEGDYRSAQYVMEQSKQKVEQLVKDKGLKDFPPEYFETCLYLARCYDLIGSKTKAKAEYESLAAHKNLTDSNIRRLAEQSGPYKAKKLSKLFMPFSSYIPFE